MLDTLAKDPTIIQLLSGLNQPPYNVELTHEGWGGFGPLLALIHQKLHKPILFVGKSEEKVRSLFNDATCFSKDVLYFPADESAQAVRNETLEKLFVLETPLLFTTLPSLFLPVRSPANLKENIFRLTVGEKFSFQAFLALLESWNYFRISTVSVPNQFAVRGGIIDLFPSTATLPYRIEWFDEVIDSIRIFDPATQRTVDKTKTLELFPPDNPVETDALIIDYLRSAALLIGESPESWIEEASSFCSDSQQNHLSIWMNQQSFLKLTPAHNGFLPWPFKAPNNFTQHFRSFFEKARQELTQNQTLFVFTRQSSRLHEVFEENDLGKIQIFPYPLSEGFVLPSQSLQVYTDRELFGRVIGLSAHPGRIPSAPMAVEELREGVLVVHARHGIASFMGLEPISIDGKTEDYISLCFDGNDKLYVPLEDMTLVERYIGPGDHKPSLSKLGGREWRSAKKRARNTAQEIAVELVRLYASRKEIPGHAYSPDTPWQNELEEAFPYIETPDQKKAIEETKRDMESAKPMDRLILGDVGYGKTEVALRAAFKAIMDGKQVALLVPTTILAQQHFQTFSERLAAFPARIDVLSRFKTKKEQNEILSKLAVGNLDLIIGTHRLLQKDVAFKNIGLLIVDEEQRFGVTHKEALKKIKESIDVLTLSATPIPRTLYLSLLGIRDISIIETAPEERLPIKTFVLPKESALVKQSIHQELKREGQVYYLYNRVQELREKAQELQRLVPEARIAIAHGQMKSSQLEEIMWNFMKGFYDILLCTTIIENGLDIPRVNTLIVEKAEHYGLAELYQLRGRVGRSDRQAYAYFLTSPRKELSEIGTKRLQTIEEFNNLGAGYQIAMKDLELRGAGNLLGFSQHGHLFDIGFNLYCQILNEEIKKLKGEKPPPLTPKVQLQIPLNAFIPDEYVPAKSQKLDLYRRLASSKIPAEADDILDELLDRFGDPPEEVIHLIELVKLKLTCTEYRVISVLQGEGNMKVRFWDRSEEVLIPLDERLPVKVRFDFFKAQLPIIQKRFRRSDK